MKTIQIEAVNRADYGKKATKEGIGMMMTGLPAETEKEGDAQ